MWASGDYLIQSLTAAAQPTVAPVPLSAMKVGLQSVERDR